MAVVKSEADRSEMELNPKLGHPDQNTSNSFRWRNIGTKVPMQKQS